MSISTILSNQRLRSKLLKKKNCRHGAQDCANFSDRSQMVDALKVVLLIVDESSAVRDLGQGEHQRGGNVPIDHRTRLGLEARAAAASQHFSGVAPPRATPDQVDRIREARKPESQQEQEEFVLLQMTTMAFQ